MLEYLYARMAELVYAHDLKSCLVRDVGSTPTPGTQLMMLRGHNCFGRTRKIFAPATVLVGRVELCAHNSAGRVAPS